MSLDVRSLVYLIVTPLPRAHILKKILWKVATDVLILPWLAPEELKPLGD